ncbi:MAG TPA: HAMP domain-containing sensor histidine kinase [Thermoanaerobaculia bacterium]|jgi:signal transduction histidine kinase
MFRDFIERLRNASGVGVRRRVSILLPFLIIAIGLGVLAWRSYQLSWKMEEGAKRLALQHARYAADITAKNLDAGARAELVRAAEDWQQSERRVPEPDAALLRDWVQRHDWVVQVIYVPDYDPANSIYISEIVTPEGKKDDLDVDFFSSTGTIRYSYDPGRLIKSIQRDTIEQSLVGQKTFFAPTAVSIVPRGRHRLGAGALDTETISYTTKLAAPLDSFVVRSFVEVAYVGSGWQNQRLISMAVSLVATTLLGVGVLLAYRGLRKEGETMSLRAALIANVSHELRTPLSMIRLGAETLRRAKKLTDKERHDIEDQILREVLVLSHLVENVLDVARIQNRSEKAMAFTPVLPRDLIRTLVTTYESWIRSKGFEVSLAIDEDVHEQMWDRDSVSRALLNLIDNAIKYSGEDDRRIEVILRQTHEHVVIEVKDHGVGIDAKDLQKIFDPYFRAKFSDTITRRGAGLGLTLVQQILASHGGKVEVESQIGVGSTFRLLFPRDATAESREHAGRFVHAPEAF